MSSRRQYLLDTSAVIDLPSKDAPIADGAEYLISSITVAELNAGIHHAPNPVERAVRLGRLQWVDQDFDPLPFTGATARMYGQLNALVIAAGRNPRSRHMDLLIAAVAATHQLPLVTRNAKDFAGLAPLVELVDLS
jgi:predicted nucleic acid-binding protein